MAEQKILIRTPNHLGDCIMAMPMVNETREAYPGSHITVLAAEALADLYAHNPAVDEILIIPDRYVHGLVGVFKIKEIIEPLKFDIGYILPPSFSSTSSFKLAGIPERIGYITDGRRMLLTKPLPLPSPVNSEHRSMLYFNLLRRGAGVDVEYVEPKLFLTDDDAIRSDELLKVYDFAETDSFAVVSFRAVAESRRWGIDKFTRLARVLVEEFKLKVILIGTEADRRDGDGIVDELALDKVVNLAGKTSLREVAGILARSRFFVGNDSGPAHVAAAVGTPVVVLSGADDPRETSPIARRKKLLYQDYLECISCVKNRCPLKGDDFMRCMKDIPVSMVVSAIRDVYQISEEN